MSFNFFPWLIFPFLEKNFEYKELTDDQQSSCDTVIQHVVGIELYTNANSSSPSKRSKTSSNFSKNLREKTFLEVFQLSQSSLLRET